MTERAPNTFTEKILSTIDYSPQNESHIQDVVELNYCKEEAERVTEMLPVFELIGLIEDESGPRYWYYLASSEVNDLDIVITLKESPDKGKQWFLGILPQDASRRLSDEEIMETADLSATEMPPKDIIDWLQNTLQYSRQEDLAELKKMEERGWEDPELVIVEQVSEASSFR